LSEPPPERELALVQAFVDAFNARDIDRCLSLTWPDLSMATAEEWPGGGTYRGQTEVRRFLEEFLEPWEQIRYEHGAQEHVNGKVVERARWVGTGRRSGIESSVDFYSVWTITNDLIARMDVFARRQQARAFARSEQGT
jgi:ketosteroid isomerase-like protein